jgi:hypothetical protein
MAIVVFLVASALNAQLNRGALTGSVTDATGALVPNVNITVRDTGTNLASGTKTNEAGQYNLPNLPTGVYEMTFESAGFKRIVRGGIQLGATQVLRVDVVMELGAVTESVQVSAESPRLETDSPEVGTNLDSHMLSNLPLTMGNSRIPIDFGFKLTPGVLSTVAGSAGTHILGGTSYSLDVLWDGATVTTYISGDISGKQFSVEALQEFKVLTNGMSAEFGRMQTGMYNFILKSGTNDIHGSAYGGMRNEALDSNTFANNFRGAKRVPDRTRDWALSFGGPVYIPKVYDGRNKTFFYLTVERFSLNGAPVGAPSVNMPVPEWYSGDFSRLLGAATTYTDGLGNKVYQGTIYDPATFSQLPSGRWIGQMFPGNKIPVSRFSKVSQNLNAIASKVLVPPVRDASGQVPLVNNSYFPNADPSLGGNLDNHIRQNTLKMDQAIGNAHRLSGSYTFGPRVYDAADGGGMYDLTQPYGGALSKARRQLADGKYFRVAEDWTITPHLLNHINFFYNHFTNQNLPVPDDGHTQDGAQKIGLTGLAPMAGFPGVNWNPGPFVSNPAIGQSSGNLWISPAWGILNTVSFSKGRHFMKAGVDFRQNALNLDTNPNWPTFNFNARATAIPNEAFSGNLTGFGFASYLLGIVDSASYSDYYKISDRSHYYGLFFQDDFKASSKLTLNLGLRWEYQPPFSEANGIISSWDTQKTDPQSGLPGAYAFGGSCTGCTGKSSFGSHTFKDFGPRFGFAWRPADKWTVRGGYGIYFEGDLLNTTSYNGLGSSGIVQALGTFVGSADAVTPWAGIFNWDGGLPATRYLPAAYNASWGDSNRPGMIDPRYGHPGYVQQWNVNLQRELARNLVLDVGYVANKSTGLRDGDLGLLDQLPASYLAQYGTRLNNAVRSAADAASNGIPYPYPGFVGTVGSALRAYPQVQGNQTVMAYGTPLGFTSYNSLQVTVNRQFTNGLTIYGNYVWSKALGNMAASNAGANPAPFDAYNLKLEKSILNFDQPRTVKVNVEYQLPIGRGRKLAGGAGKFANAIISGWSVSAILNYLDGFPLSFSGSSPLVGGWNGGANRINIAPGSMEMSGFDKSSFNLANVMSPTNTYLNKSLFSNPAPLTLGTAARAFTQARGFGTINEDMSLAKIFPVHEKYKIQFRAEALNALNRSTLGGIITDVTNSQFGQVTGITGNRQVQVTLRLDF